MTRFDGLEDCTYTVTWTRNGKGWYTAAFEERDEAREFVADMIRENEGNCDFLWYAQRLASLDSEEFLNIDIPDVSVRFANPWLCSNNGEPEDDETEEEIATVRRALMDVIEECRKNPYCETASTRLRAMAEAADALMRLS